MSASLRNAMPWSPHLRFAFARPDAAPRRSRPPEGARRRRAARTARPGRRRARRPPPRCRAAQALRRGDQGREGAARASSRSGRRTTRSGSRSQPDQLDKPFFFALAEHHAAIGERVPLRRPHGMRRLPRGDFHKIGNQVQLIAREHRVLREGRHAARRVRCASRSPTACSPRRRGERSRIPSARPS